MVPRENTALPLPIIRVLAGCKHVVSRRGINGKRKIFEINSRLIAAAGANVLQRARRAEGVHGRNELVHALHVSDAGVEPSEHKQRACDALLMRALRPKTKRNETQLRIPFTASPQPQH